MITATAGSNDAKVRRWGHAYDSFEGTETAATCVAAHPTRGGLAVIGTSGGVVALWHAEAAEGESPEEETFLVERFLAPEWKVETSTTNGAIAAVSFSPDGTCVASCGSDCRTRVVDIEKRQTAASFTGHTDWVRDVQWSPDLGLLATASYDGYCRLWDSRQRRPAGAQSMAAG